MLSPYDYELLSRFRNAPQAPQSDQERWEFNRLQREGYIFPEQTEDLNVSESTGQCAIFWKITEKGEAFLKEADEVARKNAQKEHHERLQTKLGIAQLLLSLISFVLGLVIEHFAGIADFIFGLLQ